MSDSDNIDHAEHEYWRNNCPVCDCSPCSDPQACAEETEAACRALAEDPAMTEYLARRTAANAATREGR